MRLFLTLLRRHIQHAGIESLNQSIAGLAIQEATRFADAGDANSAIGLLQSVSRNAGSELERCEALTRRVDVELLDHRREDAVKTLEELHNYISTYLIGCSDVNAVWNAYAARALMARQFFGATFSARPARSDDRGIDFAAPDLLIARAEIAVFQGDSHKAAQVVRSLKDCSNGPFDDTLLAVDAISAEAQVQYWISGDLKALEAGHKAAMEAAMGYGLQARALLAEYALLVARWAHTKSSEERNRARLFYDRTIADRKGLKALRFALSFLAADAELAHGNPWRALDAATRAQELARNGADRSLLAGMSARSLAIAGRFRPAGQIANQVLSQATLSRDGRALLAAKQALATVALATGERKNAVGHLHDVAHLAARFGTVRLIERTNNDIAQLERSSASRSIV
jgi:hypothetical protein